MRDELQPLARLLWRTGVVAVKDLEGLHPFGFRTPVHHAHSSAPLAPFFVNTHPISAPGGAMTPEIADAIGGAMVEHIVVPLKLSFTVIAGVPHGATPFADTVARVAKPCKWPVVRFEKVRSDKTSAPTVTMLQRGTVCGDETLLIHDVLGVGRLEKETVRAVCAEQLAVKHLIAFVDYEQGGGETLASNGVQCHALFTLSDLLTFAVQESIITADMAGFVHTYLKVWK